MGISLATLWAKMGRQRHQPKSPYHELADLWNDPAQHKQSIIDKCLSLGLRGRASKFINEAGVYPTLRQRMELALLYGDLNLVGSWRDEIYDYCKDSRCDSRSIAIITQRIVATDPDLVIRIGRSAGPGKVPCYAAAEILVDRVSAKTKFSKRKLFSLGGDGRLLAANLSSEPVEKFDCLKSYFNWHGIPHALSKKDIFSWGAWPPNGLLKKADIAGTISVVITTFNCEKFIVSSISSLLRQSVVPVEIIVVDDASTDNTISVLEELVRIFPRIVVVPLSANVGTYRAKNIGMQLARGDYVTFQDADDLSHPLRLEICLAEMMRDSRLMAVTCNYFRVDGKGDLYSPKVWPLTQWSPNTVFFNKQKVFEQGLMMDDTRFGGDSEYVARLKTVFGARAHRKIPKPLLLALHRPGSLMTAAITGLNSKGISVARMEYQEAWSERLFRLALDESLSH